MKRTALLFLGVFLIAGLSYAGTSDEDPDIFRFVQDYARGVTPAPEQIAATGYLTCSWESAQRGRHQVDYKMFRITIQSDHFLLEELMSDNPMPRTGLRYTSAGLLGRVSENFYLSFRYFADYPLVAEAFYALTTPYENSADLGAHFNPAVTYAQGYAHSYMWCMPTTL